MFKYSYLYDWLVSLLENDLFHTHMNCLTKAQNCTNDQCILRNSIDIPSFLNFSFYLPNFFFTALLYPFLNYPYPIYTPPPPARPYPLLFLESLLPLTYYSLPSFSSFLRNPSLLNQKPGIYIYIPPEMCIGLSQRFFLSEMKKSTNQ